MLHIYSPAGLDLTAFPPAEQNLRVTVAGEKAELAVDCWIGEDEAYTFNRLNGTVYFDDGQVPVVYVSTGTIHVQASRFVGPGLYSVRVEASDYNLPTPNQAAATFPFLVVATSGNTATPIVYGPILPKDEGYPNAEQWSFNSSTDLDILASSVKMLLTTNKGERVMLPDYGTNLRAILFEFEATGIENMVQHEIATALTAWEPRVALQFLSVTKTGDREYTVVANFVSKLNQEPFSLNLTFT